MTEKYKYTCLSELTELPRTGAFIVGLECFYANNGNVTDSIFLSENTIQAKIGEARDSLGLPPGVKFYYDDINLIDPYATNDNGKILTTEEALAELDNEEQDDLTSFREFLQND